MTRSKLTITGPDWTRTIRACPGFAFGSDATGVRMSPNGAWFLLDVLGPISPSHVDENTMLFETRSGRVVGDAAWPKVFGRKPRGFLNGWATDGPASVEVLDRPAYALPASGTIPLAPARCTGHDTPVATP